MVKLTILKPDGSHYWCEHFNSRAECDKWLAQETTRPYWKVDFTYSIEDNSEEMEQQALARQAEFEAKKEESDQLKADLLQLSQKQDWTLKDARASIEKIMKHLGL
jgi:hypothetical protein